MYPQLSKELNPGEVLVEMNTTMGSIKIKLFPEQAPKTVENFLGHAKSGYYNGIIFHRVIPNFMVQGGDPTGTGMGGESIWGGSFEDEFSPELLNIRGALSMANAGPGTNGSQFFIVQAPKVEVSMLKQMEVRGWSKEEVEVYKENGGTPWLDGKHSVFGQVVEGMDVVDKIVNVDKNMHDKPKEDVKIESITVID
ncbi:peptidylprolyl isomerase [Lysinibacillus sp. 2017]|uniref:peptidylprolyl isomerase n=1 Tax=unclassified Lysinibacillus TaxID=2636778 RepID=UPI000D528397|nr:MULTISPECIES: peptidylprolyl isomerase [unclassified Lysinibacillus]AWE08432.1 peptidylprolyl isomerase [Lysinibacillus sp. 2017]TGN34920.1 peptidylprolyl isomerase [Lysinibacillus sp. S2017]